MRPLDRPRQRQRMPERLHLIPFDNMPVGILVPGQALLNHLGIGNH